MLNGGGGRSRATCMVYGLDRYDTDHAQHLIAAGWDLDDLDDISVDRDMCDVYCRYLPQLNAGGYGTKSI